MPVNETRKLLRFHCSERDNFQGRPLYQAVVDKCRELGVCGVSVFRGIESYGETAEIRRRHLTHHNQPILVMIVETAETLRRLIPALETMMDTGLIAISDVMMKRVQKK